MSSRFIYALFCAGFLFFSNGVRGAEAIQESAVVVREADPVSAAPAQKKLIYFVLPVDTPGLVQVNVDAKCAERVINRWLRNGVLYTSQLGKLVPRSPLQKRYDDIDVRFVGQDADTGGFPAVTLTDSEIEGLAERFHAQLEPSGGCKRMCAPWRNPLWRFAAFRAVIMILCAIVAVCGFVFLLKSDGVRGIENDPEATSHQIVSEDGSLGMFLGGMAEGGFIACCGYGTCGNLERQRQSAMLIERIWQAIKDARSAGIEGAPAIA